MLYTVFIVLYTNCSSIHCRNNNDNDDNDNRANKIMFPGCFHTLNLYHANIHPLLKKTKNYLNLRFEISNFILSLTSLIPYQIHALLPALY